MKASGVTKFALCQIALLIFVSVARFAFAQDEEIPASLPPGAVKPPPVDLVYQSIDLLYGSGAQTGSSTDLKGKGQSLSGGAVDLKSEVEDLVSKGIDIKEEAEEIKINLPGDILFDFDKADIRADAEPTLAAVGKFIQGRKNSKVLIEGHTDSKGDDNYNLKLSDRRAASVKDWFGKHGVNTHGMRTYGLGESKPVAPNTKPNGADDPDGRQKNRRVEITIKK
jgi:outer membrane protein OmpA-like peptidoglycan-associated protein